MRTPRTHPMVLIAAVAVTIFSIIGVAAITGWIPTAHSERMEQVQAATPNGKAIALAPQTADPSVTSPPPVSAAKQVACSNCGVIESIRLVHHEGRGSGLGVVAGGVTGGLIGNQIGKGRGNTLLTVLGAGGGAVAGNAIEKNMKSTSAYVTKIRMQDGSYRSVTQATHPAYAIGDHVKVVSGHIAAIA